MLRMISVIALFVLSTTVLSLNSDMDIPKSSGMDMGDPLKSANVEGVGEWLDSAENAKAISVEKKLPLLLHFEADWCGACRQMESSVMNQKTVLERLGTSVIAVRVNADRDPGLIARYGISSLPTEIVIGVDGKELARYVGGVSLKDYIARLATVGSQVTPSSGSDSGAAVSEDENLRPCLLVVREGQLVGLGAYSPVAMQKDKKWLKGKEEFVGTYLGVDYFFQSAEERELFFASPEAYIPQLHGCDPVELQLGRRAEAGAIELGAFYKGRLFFFLNEKNRQRFQNNPSWYAEGLFTEGVQNVDKFPFLKTMTLN